MRRLHSILALAVLALVIVAAAIGSASITSSTATSIDVHFDGYACGQTHTFTDDTGQTVTGSTAACPTVVTQTIANGTTLSGSVHWEAFVNPDLPYSDGDPDSGVDFYVDGAFKHHEEAGNPWCYLGNSVCTLDTTTLANGSHALTAKAIDVNGSVLASVTANVTVSNVQLGTALPARMPASSGSTTVVSPGANLNTVLAGVTSGTTIQLHGGNYPTQFITSKHFSATNPVTIETFPGDSQAVFTGPTSNPSSSTNAVYLGDVQGLRIRNVTVTAPYSSTGIKIDCGVHVEIDGAKINNTGTQIATTYGGQGMLIGKDCTGTPADGTRSNDVQVWDSTISNWEAGSGGGAQTGHSHGIYTAQLDNGVIANNVFYNDTNTAVGWGIQLGGSTTGTLGVNNTFDRIKVPSGSGGFGGGIVVWGASSYGPLPSGNRMEDNLFTNLSEWGVTSSGSAASPLSNYVLDNDAFNNGKGQYQPLYGTNRLFYCTAAGTTACPGDNYAPFDPLYANGAGHDYHLQSGSPARGKGDPAYTPPFDKDGNARSAPALGAYG